MASHQEDTIQVGSTTEEFEPIELSPGEDEASQNPQQLPEMTVSPLDKESMETGTSQSMTSSIEAVISQRSTSPDRMRGSDSVQAVISQQRSTSPLRTKSPLRRSSPERTRKFFQEKVHEVVRRARYGQWDFDFSPTPSHPASDEKCPPLTVPPWGPVSAKEIFSGILRPGYDDQDWTYRKQKSLSHDSHGMPTCAE